MRYSRVPISSRMTVCRLGGTIRRRISQPWEKGDGREDGELALKLAPNWPAPSREIATRNAAPRQSQNTSTYNQILSKYPHDSLTPKTPGFDSESSNFTGIRSNCGDAPECHRCAFILNVVQPLPCQLCQCVSHRLSMAQCHYVVALPTVLAIIMCFVNLPACAHSPRNSELVLVRTTVVFVRARGEAGEAGRGGKRRSSVVRVGNFSVVHEPRKSSVIW